MPPHMTLPSCSSGDHIPQRHLIEPDDIYTPSHHVNCLANNQPLLPRATHFCNSVLEPSTGNILEYRHLIRGPDKSVWKTALANDLGRLAQGVGTRMPKGTNTIVFVAKTAVPTDRTVSYCRLVASLRPNKAETHRVRVMAGGNLLECPDITSTDTASLTTTKCLLNSVLSTPNARFATADIKDFYYGTPLQRFEYVRMQLTDIPDEIVNQYKLRAIATNGWIYMEIRKGMPGLKQAGKVANDRLVTHLAKYGYAPCKRTPALWKHKSRPITFTLCVDDFGIKYVGKQHIDHLLDALRDLYTITVDWKGELYLGLTLKWDYVRRQVNLSMPAYIPAVLLRFQHPSPSRGQHSPIRHAKG